MSNPFGNPPQPGAAAQTESDLEFELPEDPTWSPMEFADVLAMDGYYGGVIIGEKLHKEYVILTVELKDEDVAGKKLSVFLSAPTADASKFIIDKWRGLYGSIWGAQASKGRVRYKNSAQQLVNNIVFFKVKSFDDKKTDERRSGIDVFVTKDDWIAAHTENKARWAPVQTKAKTPAGTPPAFPGMPGAPTSPPQPPPPPATAPLQNGHTTAPPPAAPPAPPAPPPAKPVFPTFPSGFKK